MAKWIIDVQLKSGTILNCCTENDLRSSLEVAETYFSGDYDSFKSLRSQYGYKHILYRLGDVSAIEISSGG